MIYNSLLKTDLFYNKKYEIGTNKVQFVYLGFINFLDLLSDALNKTIKFEMLSLQS